VQIHKAFVLLALAAIVVWGTAAQDEGIKIGVVDVELAVTSSTEGKAAREELARKQREAEAKLQPMFDKYKGLEDDLKQKRFALSDEALFQKQLDLAQLRNELENQKKALEGQLQLDGERLQRPLLKKLDDVISAAGKESGFTMILRRDAPGLLYAREALDITDLIIKKYNSKG
jgi:outer membrane protein